MKVNKYLVALASVATLITGVLAGGSAVNAASARGETAGGVANTWTNPSNAGGYAGPQIGAYQTVQIACKLQGFRVADGNTWWYQIASAPWNYAYYVSADAFYNNGSTSGSLRGTPFVDGAVPDCASQRVNLARGQSAPAGYRYAITLIGFPAYSLVSLTCYDSISTYGFFTFSLRTNLYGTAFTQSYCYSGDGPDHWVVANGQIGSNHVGWGGSSGGGATGGGATGGGGSSGGGGGSVGGPSSVFFSPISNVSSPYSNNNGQTYYQGPSTAAYDLPPQAWNRGSCGSAFNPTMIPSSVSILSGWSYGRLGPVYFLAHATTEQKARIHTIILFDPGDTGNFTGGACDQRYNINQLLANWLRSNGANQLLVMTGMVSEEKQFFHRYGRSTFAGLWKYYFAGIWNQPFANRALVCDYNSLDHYSVLADFRGIAKFPPSGCPVSSRAALPVAWHP